MVSRADPVPESLPVDERWPRAGHWLSAGAGRHPIDLAVLGVPTFARSLNKAGTHTTPAAIRRALHHYTTWCASRHVDLVDLWPWDVGDVDEPDRDDGAFRVQAAVKTALAKARLLVTLGGDGSATVPIAQGLDLKQAGLVALDVQYDLREGARNTSALRTLFDTGLEGERVGHVGAADWAISRSHADEAKARGMALFSRGAVEERGIAACMSDALASAGRRGPVHVSLDLSVCERSVAPACLDALPGGLSAAELLAAAFMAGRDSNVRSVDIVEVDATADAPDYRTIRLAALVVLEVAAGLALRPQA
ncbi:MAG TPA: arginase family protein [Acidothermaceae bacterium]|nr:arginase family protein [Acidothermaceae bacterium]